MFILTKNVHWLPLKKWSRHWMHMGRGIPDTYDFGIGMDYMQNEGEHIKCTPISIPDHYGDKCPKKCK